MTAAPPGGALPWHPEDLPVPAPELAAFSYVVLEEVVGSLALLRRWRWPVVDPLGRLVWPDDGEHDSDAAGIDIALLRAQLYTPNKLKRRPRCGDTFAVQAWPDSDRPDEHAVDDLRMLFTGSVYDISAVAREAAKLAYHAGLGAVPPAEKMDEQDKAQQAEALRSRASRPLRSLKVAARPRGLR
jgi:hypothetical protein